MMRHSFCFSRRLPSNYWRSVLCLFSAVLFLMTAVAPNLFAQAHVTNPYAGAMQYLNPDYTTEVNAAIATQQSGSALANQMKVVEGYPTAVWLDRIAAIAGGSANSGRLGLQGHINAALAQQAASGSSQPIVVTLVIYDLPDRDCAALASNGEISINANPPTQPLSGIQTYEQNYITPIYNILAPYATNPNIRFVLVVEDDSLPNLITNTGEAPNAALPNCVAANGGVSGSASLTGVYVQGIQYALSTFHQLPNVYQYLDVGHHGWLGWPNNFNAAVPFLTAVARGTTAGLASVDGFITNTANYGPTNEPFMTATEQIGGQPVMSSTFYQFDTYIDEETYAAALDAAFVQAGFPSTLGFLIDTSRNGWGGPLRPTGPSTSTNLNTFVDASKIDERDDMGQWCNQTNAGLGVPPTVNPGGFANLSAYVWIKPPGESDGNYPGSVYAGNNDGALDGVASTVGDPNCDPAHDNALANNMPTGAMPNSPSAGTFWTAQFVSLVQNAFPAVPNVVGSGFSVAASSVSVEQGTTATTSVTVSAVGGFNGTVALSVSGLPIGVTATFNPASVTGSSGSTLTLVASNTATVGPATVTITGTSGATTATATLSLTVIAEPNFTVSVSPTSISLPPNTNPTATITVTFVGGLTGSVSLSATGLPAGANANFAPSSLNSSGTVVVNFNSQTSTPPGTYNASIVGTNGTITHSAALTIVVPAASDFSLAAAPTSVSVAQGGTASSTVTLTRIGGFAGAVSFTASGLPSGVTASFNPATTTTTGTSSVLTFTASSTATVGASTVTITGTSGSLTHTTTLTLMTTATATPDFSLAASPTSLSINQGASGTSTITITRLNGFASAVSFTASGLPSGVTASFNPATTTTTGTSTVLTLSASSTATLGAATVTITGTGGSVTHTATVALTVTAPATPDFSFSASPASLSINQGASGTSTITITRLNGFASAIAFTASGLPSGVTASFNPATTTTTGTSSVLTLTASSTATLGAATVTITGTGGTTTHTATVALTVTAPATPDFSLSASPASLSVAQGASGTSTITVTRLNSFAGAVAFTASGLPSGVTASFNPATTTTTGTSSVLTLSASSTATTGAATITVTGTSGSLTHTTSIALTVTAAGGGGTGGVTITPVVNSSSPWFNEEDVRLANTSSLTALSITMVIQRTTGISFSGEYNTVGGQITQANSSTTSTVTYTFALSSGQLNAGSYTFAAQTSGTGTAHPTTGDTYTVTYTAGGQNFTQTGHF
jgi:cellulose 1,4-beta-cellobiosidase